jgi:hypothetical protein
MYIGNTHAQDSLQVEIKVGFLFNPQANMSMKEPQKGFRIITPLLLGVPFTKDNHTFIPHYNLGANALGFIYGYSLQKEYQAFIIANKSFLEKGGYCLIGINKKIGFARGFVGLGTAWNTWSPDITFGVIIPITFDIK